MLRKYTDSWAKHFVAGTHPQVKKKKKHVDRQNGAGAALLKQMPHSQLSRYLADFLVAYFLPFALV